MGGVDQHLDTLVAKVAGEALGAAEPAASRTGTGCGAGAAVRPASDRVTAKASAVGQGGGKRPRLGGAAKNEDAHGPR